MAEIISRLKLQSNEFDSKIKRAGQELMAYSEHCRKTGLQMGFANQDAKDFAKALGNMETTSRTARGQVNELSEAFVNLRVMYKNMTDEEKKGDFGRNLSASLDRLKQRINSTKADLADATRELSGTPIGGGGSLFGGKLDGMLAVFGGNIMTKAAGAVASLGSEMADMVKQGIEMAKQGEGIRIAFERLGRGDILQGLREATHGTVTDLELMKAAVKFNDFRLPVEELGTMLAFAQQKAKDTGQSVDYMVDSIVTGLGRKSLMILDNLGLSASEIKERMGETGDMTKAVGDIIREQMAKAGDYVETAADRAAQANVSMQNKMEELGRKFAPIEEASNQLWTSMKIGILDIIGGPLATLLSQLTEAGRMANQYREIGGDTKVGSMVTAYNNSSDKEAYAKAVNASYTAQINKRQDIYNRLMAWRSGNRSAVNGRAFDEMERLGFGRGNDQTLRSNIAALRAQQAAFNRAIKTQAVPQLPTTVTTPTSPTTTTKPKVETQEKELTIQQQIAKLEEEAYTATDERRDAIAKQVQELDKQLERQKAIRDEVHGIVKETKALTPVQGLSGFNAETMKAWTSGRQSDLSRAEYGSADYTDIAANIADAQTIKSILETSFANGIDTAQFDLSGMWEKVFDGQNIDDSVWQNLIDTINEKLQAEGKPTIEIDFKTGNIKKVADDAKNMSKEWQAAGSAIQAVGSAMSQIEDPAAKVMGTIAQAIATVALGYAQATAQAASAGPLAWIAFAATGLATMISTISAIHSATGYANGGIVDGRGGGFVGGTAFSGDNIGNVRLDAGEVVLNRAQQGVLASELQGNPMRNMTLSTEVHAEKIRFILNTNGRRTGHGEYVQSKSKSH